MAQLLDLSTELLLLIIPELTPESIRSLALVNRRLYQVANCNLYESISYCGDRCKSLDGSHSHASNASRVNDLGLLIRTLQDSPILRSCVKRAELIWNDENDMISNNTILQLLDTMKDTRFESLILSPASLYFHIPAYTAVKSLKFRPQGHGSYIILRRGRRMITDVLYEHCCISALEEFSIEGTPRWGDLMRFLSRLGPSTAIERAKTSRVTTLRISTRDMTGRILNSILSWPKALRVLELECQTPNGIVHDRWPYTPWVNVIKPLEQCRVTLEELSLYSGTPLYPKLTPLRPINLSAFSVLKRLRTRSDFLIICRRLYGDAEGRLHDAQRPPKLFEVLPPSLEQLHLDTGDQGFLKSKNPSNLNVDEAVDWFLDRLEELILQKAEHLPNLTRVVSGEFGTGEDFFVFRQVMCCNKRPSQMKAAFARENIQLLFWWSGDEPPDFER